MYDYRQKVEKDIELNKKLELCKLKYEYFSTLIYHIAKQRTEIATRLSQEASFKYVLGYSEVELRYLDVVKNNQNDLYDLAMHIQNIELKKQGSLKLLNESDDKNDNYGSALYKEKSQWYYIDGSIDALNDVDYCLQVVRKHFGDSILNKSKQ